MTVEEFIAHRKKWSNEFNSKWKFLDIDFEMYMLMHGLKKEEYDELNKQSQENG